MMDAVLLDQILLWKSYNSTDNPKAPQTMCFKQYIKHIHNKRTNDMMMF
jgi:hypothetical protein